MKRGLVLVMLLGCAATPAAIECPTTDSSVAIPSEDKALRRWKAIAATEAKTPPAGVSAAIPELVEYLGSPDPIRRDTIAFEVLMTWMRGGLMNDADAHALLAQLLANIVVYEPDGVFRRSFSVLVLGEIVRRDTKQPYLTDAERRSILSAARDYATRETDLRGHTGATGWAHAAAHTADLLARLAPLPSFTEVDRATMLDAVMNLVVRRHGTILAYGEDGRLAVAVLAVLRAGVSSDSLDAWLAAITAPLLEKPSAIFDAKQFAAQRNTRNLLFSLYVILASTPSRGPGEQVLFDKLVVLLAT